MVKALIPLPPQRSLWCLRGQHLVPWNIHLFDLDFTIVRAKELYHNDIRMINDIWNMNTITLFHGNSHKTALALKTRGMESCYRVFYGQMAQPFGKIQEVVGTDHGLVFSRIANWTQCQCISMREHLTSNVWLKLKPVFQYRPLVSKQAHNLDAFNNGII